MNTLLLSSALLIFCCILPSQCNVISNLTCTDGKSPVQCINLCPATCQNPHPPACLALRCQPGCECTDGRILNEETGKCVSPSECSTNCSDREYATDCRNRCAPSCNEPNPPHCEIFLCVKGCECKAPYLRSDYGQCLSPEECDAKFKNQRKKDFLLIP